MNNEIFIVTKIAKLMFIARDVVLLRVTTRKVADGRAYFSLPEALPF